MLSFFPRDVLDKILNLIESVSDGFPTYSLSLNSVKRFVYGLRSLVTHCQSEQIPSGAKVCGYTSMVCETNIQERKLHLNGICFPGKRIIFFMQGRYGQSKAFVL